MNTLKQQKIWVCWKYVNDNGRNTKKPFSVTGYPTGTSKDHSDEWSDYETALAAYKMPDSGFDGVGFVMTEGLFLLDIDHRSEDDPMLRDFCALFHTYTEISPSGHGYHLYGRVDLSRIPKAWSEEHWKLDDKYYVKNSALGLELYIGGLTNRFATFTGNVLEELLSAPLTDCTDAVLTFLDTYMERPETQTALSKLDTKRFIKFSEEQIPEIVDSLCSQRNGAKFKSLYYDGDICGYGSASEADAALCAMIAFRTGPDPELINDIFMESMLYRDKWDRSDYAAATINAGIRACNGVFHVSTKVVPPFVLTDAKGRQYVSATRLADYVSKHCTYLLVREAQRGAYKKYVYKDGVYQLYSDNRFRGLIRQQIADYDGDLVKMSVVEEAFKIICTADSEVEASALNADENFINFQNGLLDLRTMRLVEHTPKVWSTIRIKADWTEKDKTPVFDAYLSALTGGDDATQTLLLEFIGAVLSNVHGGRMKKALFMYGPGDTGKSQLKRLVERLLGDGNYTGIDLQQMEARFGTSALYGRRLAGSSDMSFMTVSELKIFKKATGGDVLFAEFKGQDSFEFVYNGLLWFCMNELPKFGGDDGKWVYDRILPVHCPNVIPVSKQDHKLLDKMYAERTGIVYKAVKAFRRVIKRGYRFIEPKSSLAIRADYQSENNSALEFFRNFMMKRTDAIAKNDQFTVRKIYQIYDEWYTASYGVRYQKSQKEFFKSIAGYLETSYDEMKTRYGNGIYLKDYTINEAACAENEVVIPLV